ncbi:hypothetical protein FQN54_003784 [Arachnomyces sp. PD_36]|nr:hypothetical protein FQN54_003784 [Arachnomyces sp. PD_36]
MEQNMEQKNLPCVACLKAHSRGIFKKIPVQCVFTERGPPCEYCRDAGKPCMKIRKPVEKVATTLLEHLNSAAVQNGEIPADLRAKIDEARQEFFHLISLQLKPYLEQTPEEYVVEYDYDMELENQNQNESNNGPASAIESALTLLNPNVQLTPDQHTDVEQMIHVILPRLNALSAGFQNIASTIEEIIPALRTTARHFSDMATTMADLNGRLAGAISPASSHSANPA